ncbi:two-component system, chemotaxis family, sensor kinase CheA [Marinitoga hydrogenitolerans DSM 16785]|uniref:histidine kinase n=1 Tax=Marinitoga hydrogenitolerans (strain DSM 16785 / JCM 12826 / AT1271) TaxID=1122195 RepID=A0A1M4UTQ5_MARH1|nr:ATP-binding protein [Marinitoga hydrogenitolerans]SHE60116.1 two-component system, chemotaxis family, sensor kinase CheA [Marinitoga hydrogenitolerans DSM 16785]
MRNKMLILFFIILYISAFSYVKLYNGWEYRWEDETAWHKYETPGIPIENKNEMLYLRYKLPDVKLDNPAIYFTGIFDNSRMVVGDKLIYDSFARSFFSPKSIFKIPKDFQNKYLVIKVSSKRRDVGFFGEFLLGDELELLTHQIFVELDKILLSIFSFFILVLSLIIYIYFIIFRRNSELRRSLIFLGIFSLGIGLFISGQTQTFKYFYSNNIFWAYMMDIGKYLAPIGIMGFFYNIFDYSTKAIIKWLVFFHIIYFIFISAIQITKGFEYNYYVAYVLPLYFGMLIDIIIMLYNLYLGFKLKDIKAHIFSISIIIVSVFAIYEIMGDLRIIKWERAWIQWSIFILINSMILLILKNIKELNLELSVKSKILENWNKDLEKEINKKTKDIKLLLDNAGEGFLTFNKDYIIGKEYSNECIGIFGKNIEGLNFVDLVFNDDEKDFIKRVLKDFFEESDEFKKEVYLSFLPSEIKINYGYYKIEFKYVKYENLIMVKLTDITTEKNLKLKIEEERENLMRIVSIIRNYDAFMYNIKEFKKMIKFIQNKGNIKNYYNEIHNFKGIFSQFHLNKLTKKLHEVENDILKNKEINIEEVKDVFDIEIKDIRDELGHEIEENVLNIPKDKILELETKLKKYFKEDDEIIKEIRKLRYKDLSNLIKPYIFYIKELAVRSGKIIKAPELIIKDEILIEPEKYFYLIKSLINIYRNAIDHGIEPPEIRIEKNKEEKGNIKTILYKENNNIHIIIEDDGEGINMEKLKSIANRKNIKYNSEVELLNLIFMELISTKNEATEISGRGLGLSIVKKEVERVGGTINVESKYNKGTKFHIIIPE